MELQKRTVLSEAEKHQIDDLVKLCNRYDTTYTDIYLSNQFNYYPDVPAFFLAYEDERLVGILNIYADEADDAEIKALICPENRRQGIFRFLLQAAWTELKQKEYSSILYVVDRNFSGYENLMAALGGDYIEAEYYMLWQEPAQAAMGGSAGKIPEMAENPVQDKKVPTAANGSRKVRPATEDDIPVLAQIAAEAFDEDIAIQLKYETKSLHDPEIYKFVIEQNGQVAGSCSVSVQPELNYIFALCVTKVRQRQGLGKALLDGVIARLRAEGRKNISLSVMTDNENALKLYQNCGFATKTVNLYYKKAID